MTQITGSHAIMRSLIKEGVDIVFGYPGGAIMPTYDALYDYQDKLRHILVRHEQGAVHAAEGYAWASGKPGVCIVTSGPGATNLVTGLTDAMMDSVPIVCISGQVHVSVIGTDAFQEADVIGITAPITKWNYQITEAREIPKIIARAFHIARTGRPGPVMIDITKNAQTEKLSFSYPQTVDLKSYQPKTEPNIRQIQKAADLINSAKRPYILAGHGILISKAEEELLTLSKKADIPIALTHLGVSAVPTDYENYVGILGMHGNYGPNVLTNKADVIVAIGMRFHDRVTGRLSDYAKQATIIHIDIDPAELNKNVPADVPIVADAKKALVALTHYVTKASHPAWRAEFSACHQLEMDKIMKASSKKNTIGMRDAVTTISEETNGTAIVVADVGQHQMAAMRYYEYKNPDTHITSGGLGTMGFALPAAIGAKLAKPDKQVIAIIGDGSFQMNIQELGTIFQENIDVKIVILNNKFLGMVRQWQELFYEKRYSFTHMVSPDFIKVSEAYKIPALRVSKPYDLKKAVKTMISSSGAFLLEVEVEKEGNIFPMIPSGASVEEILLEAPKKHL